MIARRGMIAPIVGLLASLGVAVGAGPVGADRLGAAVAGGTNCTTTAGSVTVAIVIDDGQQTPRTQCLTVAKGTTAAAALGTRVTYDSSGLLCSIDGYPGTGCGAPAGTGAYAYWSYWWKDGTTWKYATTGPATRRLTADGMVEGWHFITGRDTGEGNAPRLDPTSVTFSATPPVTSPPITQPPASPTPTTPVGRSPAGAGGADTTPSTGRANGPSPTTIALPGAATTTIVSGVDEPAREADSPTSVPAVEGDRGSSSADGDPVQVAGESVTRAEPIAATTPDGSSGDGLIGAAVVVIAIVGVGTSVIIRRRRTP